ncbi:MAG: LysR family transcriptional regulator [bacterium]
MTAAARALGVSQPTISAAIRRLEKRLDTTLLLRTGRSTELTATGSAPPRAAASCGRSPISTPPSGAWRMTTSAPS